MQKFRLFILGVFLSLATVSPVFADSLTLRLPDFVHGAHIRYTDAYFSIGLVNLPSTAHLGTVYFWPLDPAQTNGGQIPVSIGLTGYAAADCSGAPLWSTSTSTTITVPAATSTYPVAISFGSGSQDLTGAGCVHGTLLSGYSSNALAYWLLDDLSEPAIVITDEFGTDLLGTDPNATRIVSVTPPDKSTQATSTIFSLKASVVISPNDFSAGEFVHMHLYSNGFLASQVVGPLFPYYESQATSLVEDHVFPITASGAYEFSTTTDLQGVGLYYITTTIEKPNAGFLATLTNIYDYFIGGTDNAVGQTLVSTTTKFTLATTTAIDELTQGSVDVANIKAVAKCDTSADFFSNLSSCVYQKFLLVDPNALQGEWDYFHSTILLRAPWGYVTRFFDIVSLQTTAVEPPALTYTFGSSSPAALTGQTISFQVWDHTDVITTIKSDDGQNKDIWEIIDPYVKLIVAFGVLGVILGDLLGLHFNEPEWRESEVISVSQKQGGQPVARRTKSWSRHIDA